ncbi:MAG TPA: hypothetical protein VGH03_15795 [Caulobacteraceae bacterium]|jgi:hypothetical protein
MPSDLPLTELFLRGDIDHRTFRHADHVRVGFELLQAHDFSTAAWMFSAALKAIAVRAGNSRAYHQTITLAFLALIAERSAARAFSDFEDFARANPDLMGKAVLERWYAPERLRSDLARRIFLLPEAAR